MGLRVLGFGFRFRVLRFHLEFWVLGFGLGFGAKSFVIWLRVLLRVRFRLKVWG